MSSLFLSPKGWEKPGILGTRFDKHIFLDFLFFFVSISGLEGLESFSLAVLFLLSYFVPWNQVKSNFQKCTSAFVQG